MSEQSPRNNCCFCNEIADGRMPAEYAALAGASERVIAGHKGFLALPSVSPIKEGHVLILPVAHLTSFAQLTSKGVVNYGEFRHRIASLVASRFGQVFFWEHGLADDSQEGCGVSHAHLHLLPLEVALAKRLHKSLLKALPHPQSVEFSALGRMATSSRSYLYWGNAELGSFGAVSDNIPSQLVRRRIAELLGSPNWDWRRLTSWDTFLRTREALAA